MVSLCMTIGKSEFTLELLRQHLRKELLDFVSDLLRERLTTAAAAAPFWMCARPLALQSEEESRRNTHRSVIYFKVL